MRIVMLEDFNAISLDESIDLLKEFLLDESTEALLRNEWPYYTDTDGIKINKHLVDKIDKIKIEVYVREHPPAHFHVKIAEYESCYTIGECRYIHGNLPKQYQKKIILRYRSGGGKDKLIQKRNETRPEYCPVGKI